MQIVSVRWLGCNSLPCHGVGLPAIRHQCFDRVLRYGSSLAATFPKLSSQQSPAPGWPGSIFAHKRSGFQLLLVEHAQFMPLVLDISHQTTFSSLALITKNWTRCSYRWVLPCSLSSCDTCEYFSPASVRKWSRRATICGCRLSNAWHALSRKSSSPMAWQP